MCDRTPRPEVFAHADPLRVVESLPTTRHTFLRNQDPERGKHAVDVYTYDGYTFTIVSKGGHSSHAHNSTSASARPLPFTKAM